MDETKTPIYHTETTSLFATVEELCSRANILLLVSLDFHLLAICPSD